MVRLVPLLVLLCVAAISAWAWLRKPEPAVLNPSPAQSVEIAPVVKEVPYTTGPASADGIGKFFHGREISKVMGHPAIGWLERTEREQEEAPAASGITTIADMVTVDVPAKKARKGK